MDKSRKKELLKKFKNEERCEFQNSLHFSKEIFEQLFDYIDEILETYGCDDTLKYTKEFLQMNNLPFQESIEWLQENGAYCDCEVLANIEDKILDI
ncbi:DUF2695 domain-containing protein [Terrisporobacter glycolicus]|uniref:DUF2695 domain-containing protein n=1 Tax=Terrisporobacter glycolicus ATCC 14880 = DSM 1288 TaxID=1121315 RepID=A0ABZ2ETG8_9FIRM|nr:DUF2695 domain-containing protein [Terrisporobacter glycolicus]